MANEASRARAGAIHLDENVPAWAEKIDPARLDLGSCDNDVIGQVFESNYWNAKLQLGLDDGQCVERGFTSELWLSLGSNARAALSSEARAVFLDAVADELRQLKAVWEVEIEARLEEARVEASEPDLCPMGSPL